MKVKVGGKVYWVRESDGRIEVEIIRSGYKRSWLKIKQDGAKAREVYEAADKLKSMDAFGGAAGLEAAAIKANIPDEWMGMWRRGVLSNQQLMALVGRPK